MRAAAPQDISDALKHISARYALFGAKHTSLVHFHNVLQIHSLYSGSTIFWRCLFQALHPVL